MTLPASRGERLRDGVGVARALLALTKPRLGFFSILTAMAAYAATASAPTSAAHALITFVGTALAAGGALSLNQWWERDLDRRMARTCGRPLPREQLSPRVALSWSLALSAGGVALLAGWIDAAAAAIATATILIYGLIYTPLKRRTRWATEIGAISGALPPLLGAAAAGDVFSDAGWMLASLLLAWQMPHFFAVGWMYRDDYRAANFRLLPAIDPTGARTAAWSGAYTVLLVLVSLVPWLLGRAGAIYGMGAVLGGAAFAYAAWNFLSGREDRDRAARQLFFVSILYLPLMLVALLLDQLI